MRHYVTLGSAVHHYVTLGRKVHQGRIGPESFGRVSPTTRHENHCFPLFSCLRHVGKGMLTDANSPRSKSCAFDWCISPAIRTVSDTFYGRIIMAGVMEHCISHCMEIFYDLWWLFVSYFRDQCTVLDVDLNEWVCVWLCVDIYNKYCTYRYICRSINITILQNLLYLNCLYVNMDDPCFGCSHINTQYAII
jgi:hypothetical protein